MIYSELLRIIDHLENAVSSQNETIARLLNENAEQENFINYVMSEEIAE